MDTEIKIIKERKFYKLVLQSISQFDIGGLLIVRDNTCNRKNYKFQFFTYLSV